MKRDKYCSTKTNDLVRKIKKWHKFKKREISDNTIIAMESKDRDVLIDIIHSLKISW